MAKDVKVGSAYIDVGAKSDQIKNDIKTVENELKKELSRIERNVAKVRPAMETALLKKGIAEVEMLHGKLKAHLEQQIKMNADIGSIQKTKEALGVVENSLRGISKEHEDVTNKASKWGMIATGIQSTVMTIRDTYQQIKQVIDESINGAADLNVLRSSFKGSPADLELFKRATAGTLKESDIIALSNRAAALKLSIEDQAIAFSFAEDKVDEYGGSVVENFNRIVNASEGMGRGLKEIGIETKVYQENLKNLVKEHGGSLEKLDAETQKEIMLKATIMSLGVTLDDVKKKHKDQKDLIEASGISIEEERLKIGNLILKGLTPLLRKYDESSEATKGFIAGTIAIGGTIIQAIPIIVQLITAKKLFALSSQASAGAIAKETIAVEANTIAKTTNLGVATRFVGALGAIGLTALGIGAVGAVVWTLAENIRSLDAKKVEDTAKALDQLARDRSTSKAFGGGGNLNAPNANIQSGSVNPNSLILTSQLNNRGSGLVSPHLVVSQIVSDNKKVAMSVEEVRKKIEALTLANQSVSISWKDYRKNLAEITRLQNSLEPPVNFFADLEKNKRELSQVNALLKDRNLTDAQRNVLLERQKELLAQIYKYEHPDTDVNPLEPKSISGTQKKGTVIGENKDKTDKPTLDDIDKEVEDSQSRVESFGQTLSGAMTQGITSSENLGSAFTNVGKQLEAMIIQALIFKAIMAALDAIPGVGSVSKWLGIGGHSGGTFVGTGGGNAMKLAGGADFIVPPGFSGDRFGPLYVETGEHVQVTPRGQTYSQSFSDARLVNEMREMKESVQALSINIIRKSSQPIIIKMNSTEVARIVTREQNEFDRGNVKVNR